MSNVLAALFGGLGAGAQSLGGSMMREQELEQQRQQRMAELDRQEQTRLALAREAQGAREREIADRRKSVGNSLRAFGINLPDDQLDIAPEALPTLIQQKRAEADAARLTERDRLAREEKLRVNRATYNAGLQAGRIPKNVQYNDDVNFMEMLKDGRIEDGQSFNRAMRVLTANLRPQTPREEGDKGRQKWVNDRTMDLMKRQQGLAPGTYDPGLPFDQALAQAAKEAESLFGGAAPGAPRPAPAPAGPPPKPAGANLLGGLGLGKPQLEPLSPEDAAEAKRNPQFRQYLINQGYQL